MRTDLTCLLIDDALSAEERSEQIARANAAPFRAMARHYPHGYRNNDRLVRDDASLARSLFERLAHVLPQTLRGEDGAIWQLVGFNERFRFCRYRDGQFFSRHQDGAFARSPHERSLLTCMIYLNGCAEFEGGLTRYFEGNADIGDVEPRAGTAIVFDHRLWHEGQAVTRGTKYVMRTDVMYRRAPLTRVENENGAAQQVIPAHTGYIWALLALAQGRLASASRDGTARLCARTGTEWTECSPPLRHSGSLTALLESEPGVLWAGTREGEVLCWRDGRPREVTRVGGAVLALTHAQRGGSECAADGAVSPGVACSSVERTTSLDVACASVERTTSLEVACASADGTVSLLDSEGALRGVLRGHIDWVWSLARLGSGLLVSGSEDGTIRAWDTAARRETFCARTGAGVRALAAKDEWLVAGLANGRVQLWSTAGEWRLAAEMPIHTGAVLSAAFTGRGWVATGGEDGRLCVSSVPQLVTNESLTHGGFVRAIADLGEHGLASGTYEGMIRIWGRPAGARW